MIAECVDMRNAVGLAVMHMHLIHICNHRVCGQMMSRLFNPRYGVYVKSDGELVAVLSDPTQIQMHGR